MNQPQKIILLLGVILLITGVAVLLYDGKALPFKTGGGTLTLPSANETKNREALAILREADELLRQNSSSSAKEAMGIFNRILAQDINPHINQLARYGLAVALERLNDTSAALKHYLILKEEGIDDPDLKDKVEYRLGRIYLMVNREEEGRSLLEAILERTNNKELKSDIHTAYGNFYLKNGDRKRAKENYIIALRYNPDNLQAELGRAEATYGSGRMSAGYEYYDEYLVGNGNLEPDKRKSVMSKIQNEAYQSGVKSYREKKYRDALLHFKRAMKSPVNSDTYENASYWVAESYLQLDRIDDAQEAFRRVTLNRNVKMDQVAMIKRGIIFYQKGEFTDAAALFRQSVAKFPNGRYTSRAEDWRRECESQISQSRQNRKALADSLQESCCSAAPSDNDEK